MPPQKQNWMPIGRFSNACRLSIKALRHYDEQGILKPAYVDPETGYRYYRPGQARDAVLISMLRSLDIPLPAIDLLLRADGQERRRLLEQERERRARDLVKQQHALRSIEHIVRAGELLPYEIASRIEPAYRVARLSIMTTAERMVEKSGALVYRLFDAMQASDYEPGDPIMCINEDADADADGNIQVHACAGVDAVAVGGNGYLNPPFNNIVEQDHRAVKRVTRPMLGFKSFNAAKCVLAGIELMHMIRKWQFRMKGCEKMSFAEHNMRWQDNFVQCKGRSPSANYNSASYLLMRQNQNQ